MNYLERQTKNGDIGPGVPPKKKSGVQSLSLTVALQLIPQSGSLSLPLQPAAEKPAFGGYGSITRTHTADLGPTTIHL